MLAFFSNSDPGLAVGPAPYDDLVHVLVIVRFSWQWDPHVVMGTRREGNGSDVIGFPDVLELVLVGRRQMDSL